MYMWVVSRLSWPAKDRYCIACAYIAKVVYNFPDTRHLIERLQSDPQLGTICGWKPGDKLPHESTFSRAFTEFAEMQLPQFVHEALIRVNVSRTVPPSARLRRRRRNAVPSLRGKASHTRRKKLACNGSAR